VQANGVCSPDGLACPTDQTIPDCNGNPQTFDCICQNGSWFCDGPGGGDCPNPYPCPAPQDVVPTAGCNFPGNLRCDSATPYYDCNGNVAGYLQCNCDQSEWSCPRPPMVCMTDASTGCPPPESIQASALCSEGLGVMCPGNPTQCNGQTDFDAFQCDNGVWVDVAHTVCDVDAGASD
jgi:hypothetical protein